LLATPFSNEDNMVKLWKNIQDLRGAAIICVVFNHAIHRFIAGKSHSIYTDYNLVEKLIITFGVNFPLASIAGFMVASGYLMGRFFSSGTASLNAAKKLGFLYLIWSIAGFLLMSLITWDFSLSDILAKLMTSFGPFPAYWFFASLLIFYLLCPFLTRWAKKRPLSLFAIFLLFECIRYYFLYFCNGYSAPWMVPFQGSYFILGSLLSQHSEKFLKIKRFKYPLLIFAVVALLLSFLETLYWWNEVGAPTGKTISWDHLTVRLFSILVVCWFLLRDTKTSKFYTWLDNLGMNSMTIFLLFDFFQQLVMIVAWHFPSLILGQQENIDITPPYMVNPTWIIIYFVIGLFGPLVFALIIQHVMGKELKQRLFG